MSSNSVIAKIRRAFESVGFANVRPARTKSGWIVPWTGVEDHGGDGGSLDAALERELGPGIDFEGDQAAVRFWKKGASTPTPAPEPAAGEWLVVVEQSGDAAVRHRFGTQAAAEAYVEAIEGGAWAAVCQVKAVYR